MVTVCLEINGDKNCIRRHIVQVPKTKPNLLLLMPVSNKKNGRHHNLKVHQSMSPTDRRETELTVTLIVNIADNAMQCVGKNNRGHINVWEKTIGLTSMSVREQQGSHQYVEKTIGVTSM